MTLTQEQIEKLSKNLSKLEARDKTKLVKDINSIIGYIDMLNEVDTTGIHPTISVIDNENILRKDNEDRSDKATPEELLSCSEGKVIGNQIALTNIMK